MAPLPVSEWPEVASNNAASSSIGASNSHGSGSISASFSFASAVAPSLSSGLQLGTATATVSTAGNFPEFALDGSSSTTVMSLFGAEVKSAASSSVVVSSTGNLLDCYLELCFVT